MPGRVRGTHQGWRRSLRARRPRRSPVPFRESPGARARRERGAVQPGRRLSRPRAIGRGLDPLPRCDRPRWPGIRRLQQHGDPRGAAGLLPGGRGGQAARRTMALKHDFPNAHFNLGMLLLRLGRFPKGFRECEWRWQTSRFTPFKVPHPPWDGRRISGTLLVHSEQGAGDAIQFARFLPDGGGALRSADLLLPREPFLHLRGPAGRRRAAQGRARSRSPSSRRTCR